MIPHVKERLDAIREVGTLPQVMARILAIVEDDSTTALDLASEISQDQALTAKILRTVNSSYYGFHRQIMTVPEAVVILGFNEVERLALAISVINTLGLDRDSVVALRRLWKHSIASSLAGTFLEQHHSHPENMAPRGAHVSGLLHSIGMAAIAQHVPEASAPIHKLMQDEGCSVAEAESQVLGGITHCDVGSWLAERWDLPVPLVEAIAYHKDPAAAPVDNPLVHATHVIDHVCNKLGYGPTIVDHVPPLHKDSAARFACDEAFEKALHEHLERNQRIIGAISSAAMF